MDAVCTCHNIISAGFGQKTKSSPLSSNDRQSPSPKKCYSCACINWPGQNTIHMQLREIDEESQNKTIDLVGEDIL